MNEAVYIGVATPQANPTVEVEFQRFWRGPVYPVFTRLTSKAENPASRVVEYIEQIPDALATFDALPLRAFAFACTASSYLVGNEREEAIVEAAERQYRVQVVTATQAIRRELQGRGAQRIAIMAPYPTDILDAARRYWESLGVDIVALGQIDTGTDTRRIYELSDVQVADALDGFETPEADLLLLSGTGMPTINALQRPGLPVLSSNLCLATEMMRRTQQWPPTEAANVSVLLGGSD